MKVTFNVDCTPDEARSFLGLPDVKPMHDALMQKVQKRMSDSIDAMTPEALLKTWLPASVQSVEQMQKMFWNAFAAGRAGKGTE